MLARAEAPGKESPKPPGERGPWWDGCRPEKVVAVEAPGKTWHESFLIEFQHSGLGASIGGRTGLENQSFGGGWFVGTG